MTGYPVLTLPLGPERFWAGQMVRPSQSRIWDSRCSSREPVAHRTSRLRASSFFGRWFRCCSDFHVQSHEVIDLFPTQKTGSQNFREYFRPVFNNLVPQTICHRITCLLALNQEGIYAPNGKQHHSSRGPRYLHRPLPGLRPHHL